MEGVYSPSICCSHKGGTGGPGTYWNDLLKTVKINGVTKELKYDTIGNPTTYFNGTVWNFTWQNGRHMATAQNQAQTQTLRFTYGVDGIRTSKTVNGVTHHYINQNGKVIREYWTQNGSEYILDFFYDVNGKPLALYYRVNGASTAYYYQTNLQGDVMKIFKVTSSGGVATATQVASYAYDAWGNVEAVVKASADDKNIANLNPLRYRGYYYDTETGLYYVSSRYYDPEIGRFINADDIDYLGADGSPLSYNLFAYCMNNPVNRFDVNGNWSMPNWLKVTVGAVAIAGLAVATVCTGGAAAVICGAALSGAIAGGASGAVMGAIGGGISGGWQGALDGACSGFMSGTLIGGATGAASAGLNIATGATTVVGNAHGSTLHKLATNMEAGKMAASGQYSQIGINKSLGKMGLNGGLTRPDVIGIGKNGVNKLVEVVSPRQSTTYISTKMSNMLSNNPGTVGKIVNWVRRLFK